jgi:hypothetical protein
MPEAAESTSCVSPSHATAVRSHKIQSVKSRATARVEKRAFTIYHGRFLAVQFFLIVSFLGSKPSSSDEQRLEPFFGHRLTP